MTHVIVYLSFLLYLTTTLAQYDPYGPIQNRNDDRNQYNQSGQQGQYGQGSFDRPYDRPGQGGQYGQYDNRDRYSPYDRNRTDQYGQGQYGGQPAGQPGPYDRDRNNPYGSGTDKNRYDPYGNRTDQYGQQGQQGQYDRDRYGQGQYGQGQYGQGQGQSGQQGPYGQSGQGQYGQQGQYDRNRFGQGQGNYNQRNFGQTGFGSGGFGTGESINDLNCCDEYCYTDDRDPYLKFATKTAYQFVYGKNSQQFTVPECRPIQFWSLNTPGTSLPDQLIIDRLSRLDRIRDDIMNNYERQGSYPSRGRLCQEDFENLKRWHWNETVTVNSANALSSQGQDDIKLLIRRYQSKFRDLLSMPYSEAHFTFQYSNMDRIHDSYQAYLEGLFTTNTFNVHARVENDNMVNEYDTCGSQSSYNSNQYGSSNNPNYNTYGGSSSNSGGYNTYNTNTSPNYNNPSYNNPSSNNLGYNNPSSNNPSYNSPSSSNPSYNNPSYNNPSSSNYNTNNNYNTYSTNNNYNQFQSNFEYFQFKERPEYKELVKHVFRRLGYRYVLNDSIVEDIYDMCRYEKAWYINRPSPWCAAFTRKHLEILEYAQDLKEFYANGYGNEQMNSRRGCRPIRSLFDKFQNTVNGLPGEKVTVSFTSNAALQHALVSIGALKDYSPLTATNYYTQTRRKWRTADIAPFAGNLVAILYECDPNARDKYKVMFFLNENPVEFPECSVGLCSWDTLKNKFQDIIYRCGQCNGASAFVVSNTFYLLSIIAILFYKIQL